jgi:CubicO group peptidase (beta-lactamase class C family)
MAPETMDPEAFLEEQVRAQRLPGATWVVARGERVLSAGAVGWARLVPRRRRAQVGTIYDLASLTKPLVTATLAVLLARDGVVSLDEPAGERLPELANSPYAGVDLLALLTHQARLPGWEPLYLQGGDLPAYLRCIARLQPHGRPGVVYSDLGYILAGVLLMRAARKSLDRLFQQRVAGLLSDIGAAGPLPVRYRPPAAWRGRIASTEEGDKVERQMVAGRHGAGAVASYDRWRRGVVHGEVHDRNAAILGGVAGHAGLFGSALGVAVLGSQFLPGSRIFSMDELALFVTPRTPPEGELRTLGFLVPVGQETVTAGALSPRAFGHTGFTGTSLFIDPEDGAVCVLLSNRGHPAQRPTDMRALRRGFHETAARVLARDCPEPSEGGPPPLR